MDQNKKLRLLKSLATLEFAGQANIDKLALYELHDDGLVDLKIDPNGKISEVNLTQEGRFELQRLQENL